MSEQMRKAVALRYDPGQGLPQLVFKGVGPLADEAIRRSVQGRGPALVKDADLVDRLYRLPIDAPIGPDLYRAVAVVMAHVLAIEARLFGEKTNV
jgi:flagellar biosynthesis protein